MGLIIVHVQMVSYFLIRLVAWPMYITLSILRHLPESEEMLMRFIQNISI